MPCLSPNQDSSLQDCCDLWQYTLTGIRLQSFHATPPFCKSHFGLQVFSDSLNSFGAVPEAAEFSFSVWDHECISNNSPRRIGFPLSLAASLRLRARPHIQFAVRDCRHPRKVIFF